MLLAYNKDRHTVLDSIEIIVILAIEVFLQDPWPQDLTETLKLAPSRFVGGHAMRGVKLGSHLKRSWRCSCPLQKLRER